MAPKRRGLLGRCDSGAVAVETALVMTVLVTLLFGIVDSSFLFKDSVSVSTAARAGARMGASQPRVSNFAQAAADQVTNSLSDLNPALLQAVWVYKTTSTGASAGLPDSGSFASCTTCVKFIWNVLASPPGCSRRPTTGPASCRMPALVILLATSWVFT